MRKSKAKYILLRIKSRRLHNKVLELKKSTNCYRELYKERGDQPTSSSPSPVERRGVALCKANSHATAAPMNKTRHVHPRPRKRGVALRNTDFAQPTDKWEIDAKYLCYNKSITLRTKVRTYYKSYSYIRVFLLEDNVVHLRYDFADRAI